MRTAQSGAGPPGGRETILVILCIAALAIGGVVYSGAWLATRFSGGWVSPDLGSWGSAAVGLIRHPADPAGAWGTHASGLPGPLPYWACTGAVLAAVGLTGAAVVWTWRRLAQPELARFGVETDARLARRRDIRTLVVGCPTPPTGRLLLGGMAPNGPLLATEDRERHPLAGRAGRRQGSRGSVALIGPTQSGKTVLIATGMIGWDGPVIALSVKRDLYDVTASARAGRGELAVFDPGASTGLATARWSPLRSVATASGALRAGRALAGAIPRNGVDDGDYWAQQGETFVSAYMALAGLSVRLGARADGTEREVLTIQTLTSWAFSGIGITDPTVNELVRSGLESKDLETQLLAEAAALKLTALHHEDPRIRASIYATARLAFEAWAEPPVAHSASDDPRDAYHSDEVWDRRPRFVDLDWLMGDPDDGRGNTLYLIAPDTEFKRLAPVLGGLLGDFREQIHAWDIEGRRLAKPLLIVIDEAAQLELAWLPEEVSTIAGLGGVFVTGWQSKAQIDHRYGALADAVLGGHRSKVIFTGCDDPATLDWLRKVAGHEHVARRSWSADTGGGRRTISETTQREDLASPHVVRQMLPGEAVLMHGTLPPIHLRSVAWWKDKTLRRLVPTDPAGRPVLPEVPTCPTTDDRPRPADVGLDRTTRSDAIRHLPPPSKPSPQPNPPPTVTPATSSEPVAALGGNRSGGRCTFCAEWVPKQEGTSVRMAGAESIVCEACGDVLWDTDKG